MEFISLELYFLIAEILFFVRKDILGGGLCGGEIEADDSFIFNPRGYLHDYCGRNGLKMGDEWIIIDRKNRF